MNSDLLMFDLLTILLIIIYLELSPETESKKDWKQNTVDQRCTTKAQTNDEHNGWFSESNIDENELYSVVT